MREYFDIIEIQKHTTLQYRAPEMIDLYQHKLISEKVDIWVRFFIILLSHILLFVLILLLFDFRLLVVYFTSWPFIKPLLRIQIPYKF